MDQYSARSNPFITTQLRICIDRSKRTAINDKVRKIEPFEE